MCPQGGLVAPPSAHYPCTFPPGSCPLCLKSRATPLRNRHRSGRNAFRQNGIAGVGVTRQNISLPRGTVSRCTQWILKHLEAGTFSYLKRCTKSTSGILCMADKSQSSTVSVKSILEVSFDSIAVIAFRCARIGRGGADALLEANLMVTEKVEAWAFVSWSSITGAYGVSPVSVFGRVFTHYSQCIRSNRQRLTYRSLPR